MAGHRFALCVHQHETAGAIGVFSHAAAQACLAKGRRLLIACHAGNGYPGAKQSGRRVAIQFAATHDSGQDSSWHVQHCQQIVIPGAGMDVKQQSPAGIGGICNMQIAAGKVPNQPAVDRAETQLPAFSAPACPRHVVQEPGDLGAAEIGIQPQAGARREQGLMPRRAQFVAGAGRAPVLPDDGVVNRQTGHPVPDHRRLTLIGDANGRDVVAEQPRPGYRFAGHAQLSGPDLRSVVFHPAGLRKYLARFFLCHRHHGACLIEQDGAAAGRALIQGQNVAGHEVVLRLSPKETHCRLLHCKGQVPISPNNSVAAGPS